MLQNTWLSKYIASLITDNHYYLFSAFNVYWAGRRSTRSPPIAIQIDVHDTGKNDRHYQCCACIINKGI